MATTTTEGPTPKIADALQTAETYPHRVPLALTPEQYQRLRRLRFDTDTAGAELLRLAFDAIGDDRLAKLANQANRRR